MRMVPPAENLYVFRTFAPYGLIVKVMDIAPIVFDTADLASPAPFI